MLLGIKIMFKVKSLGSSKKALVICFFYFVQFFELKI